MGATKDEAKSDVKILRKIWGVAAQMMKALMEAASE